MRMLLAFRLVDGHGHHLARRADSQSVGILVAKTAVVVIAAGPRAGQPLLPVFD